MISAGLVLLRLALAAVLVAHGAHTLGLLAAPGAGPGGLTMATAHYASLGLAAPFALALTMALLRLVGGLLMAIGYLTRSAGLLLVASEGVNVWKDSGRWGFFLNWTNDPSRGHGIEFGLLMVGALACLILTGAGDWSIDGRRARSSAARSAGRARLRER